MRTQDVSLAEGEGETRTQGVALIEGEGASTDTRNLFHKDEGESEIQSQDVSISPIPSIFAIPGFKRIPRKSETAI
jgi:hypothetical protein